MEEIKKSSKKSSKKTEIKNETPIEETKNEVEKEPIEKNGKKKKSMVKKIVVWAKKAGRKTAKFVKDWAPVAGGVIVTGKAVKGVINWIKEDEDDDIEEAFHKIVDSVDIDKLTDKIE